MTPLRQSDVPSSSIHRPPREPRLPVPRALSRRLVRAAAFAPRRGEAMTLGELVAGLGDRSFGWCIVVFALVNLIPMPFGSLVMALPLIFVTAQMALGLPELRLPKALMQRRIDRRRFQAVVMRVRPIIRPIERLVRPRNSSIISPRSERAIGALLFAVSVALFVPLPLSGYLPALALLVTGIGLVERDGLVALAGLTLGAVAVAVTASMGGALVLGVQFLAS